MPRALPILVAALLAALAAAIPASAQDPGRWRAAGHTKIPLEDYQGVTADPLGQLIAFDGIFTGLHTTDARLRPRNSVEDVIPPEVTATEGFNHIGDLTWDRREGGRLLLPLECYTPGAPNGGNTCGHGALGVADPVTLRWRYRVLLDPAEIAKAMWAETSPDGALVWTSSGPDLLAYRSADVNAAHAGTPLRAVRRLRGAVPPSGVTGAAFYGDRLLLAGQATGPFQVWSVDLATGARRLEISLSITGESEGLLVADRPDGVLHWIVTPFDPQGRPPTYPPPGNALLHFRPAGTRAKLRATASRPRRGRTTVTARGPAGPVAGALVRAGRRWALTSARGRATVRVPASRRLTVSRADLRSARVAVPR